MDAFQNTGMTVCNEVDRGFAVELKFLRTLPDQVLAEILIRLPNKSACRFKLVCKEWCSLISSSYFSSLYINHCCQDTCKNFTLMFNLGIIKPSTQMNVKHVNAVSNHPVLSKLLETRSLNRCLRKNFKRQYERRNMILPLQGMKISVEASCHDFLLCSDSWNYSVVNLITGKRVVIPPVPKRTDNLTDITCFHKIGLLGYHDHNKKGLGKFKLILVPFVARFPRSRILESSGFSIDMYCSEMREWSVVNVEWHPLKLNAMLSSTRVIAHDGMLHWLNRRLLVSVDPFSGGGVQLASAIKLPKEFQNHYGELFGLCCGLFRVVGCKQEGYGLAYRVWDLRNNHDNKSWLLSHKIVLNNSFLNRGFFFLMAVHPCDTDVIFVIRGNVIYLFNLRTGRLEEYRKLKLKLKLQMGYRGIFENTSCVMLH